MVIKQIPYVDLKAQHQFLKSDLVEAVTRVIERSQFILGEEVQAFERAFADLCGVRFAVGVNSGLDALILALRALGIGPGDEVITVPNSFIASVSCIMLVGAQPVFVDVRDDYNMDPTQLEQAITSRTRAILPIHLTGRPADMHSIMEIANKHDLFVVEDCAQAVLAEYDGQRTGSLGHVGCFSLHPLKTLNACGDGGVLTTNDEELFKKLKLLRNHGLHNRDECIAWGLNSRLDTLQAVILLLKMRHLQKWTDKRCANAQFYQKNLQGISGLIVPTDRSHEKAVYHTFIVQAENRNELKQYLANHGVGTAIHYPIPIHLQRAAANLEYRTGSFPVTERQAKRILSLPVYPELPQADLEYIVNIITKFYQG